MGCFRFKILRLSGIIFSFTASLYASDFTIHPYLQNPSPNSIHISWQTESQETFGISWGQTTRDQSNPISTATIGEPSQYIYHTTINDLTPNTTYSFQIVSDSISSEVLTFKTLRSLRNKAPFRFIAISDTQRDDDNPDKLKEIVDEGIIPYLDTNSHPSLKDSLDFIIVPGDLVYNGDEFNQWQNQFFNPAENILKKVPFLSVLGNHDENSDSYFEYFTLPNNGSPEKTEHWWHKQIQNIQLIGLNSNSGYRTDEQVEWLTTTLEKSCSDTSIDFVVVQMHHPAITELWLSGETRFIQRYIDEANLFSENCDTFTIMIFGHTHAYSRGSSSAGKVVFVSTGSAGGALDYWGQYPQKDYEDFSVSEDEWGFTVFDIIPGDIPKLTISRVSRGDDLNTKENDITDHITYTLSPNTISVPTTLTPVGNELAAECIILESSHFTASDPTSLHQQSQWQIATSCSDFSNPVFNEREHLRNIFYEVNTQEGNSLITQKVTGLEEATSYCWRVRYRDNNLNWSSWSIPESFSTTPSSFSPNLILNAGAENDIEHWTIEEGIVESLEPYQCRGSKPYEGERYFTVGGVCENSPFASMSQTIPIHNLAENIDNNNLNVLFGAYLSNWKSEDTPEIILYFKNNYDEILDSTPIYSTNNTFWTSISEWASIPQGTRSITMQLRGHRNSNNDNDSYFDNIFLKISELQTQCTEVKPFMFRITESGTNILSSTTQAITPPQETYHSDENVITPINEYTRPATQYTITRGTTHASVIITSDNAPLSAKQITVTNVLGEHMQYWSVSKHNRVELELHQSHLGSYFISIQREQHKRETFRFSITE